MKPYSCTVGGAGPKIMSTNHSLWLQKLRKRAPMENVGEFCLIFFFFIPLWPKEMCDNMERLKPQVLAH